jgi:hypothetical protein
MCRVTNQISDLCSPNYYLPVIKRHSYAVKPIYIYCECLSNCKTAALL